MQIDIQSRWVRSLVAVLFVGLVAAATTGCEQSPKDKLRAAKVAVMNEKPDEAAKQLEAVLEAEPDNFEAKRLQGSVERLGGNYVKAEERLKALWSDNGFDKADADLSTEQKSKKQLLKADMLTLYGEWAESMDSAENPDKFVEVVKKGLEIDPKKTRLNTMLVTAHENQAKKLVEQGKKLEAAAVYEKIPTLYTSSAKRKKANERATNLRFEANKEQMLGYFNEKAKPKLVSAERYDAKDNAILFSVEQDVDEVEKYFEEKKGQKVRLDARNKKHQPIIHQFTIGKKLVPALTDVVVEATGIPSDSDFSKVQTPEGFEIVEVDAGRGDYTINAKIPVDAVLKLGFEVKEQTRKAEKAARDGEGDKADDGDAKGAKAEADKKSGGK